MINQMMAFIEKTNPSHWDIFEIVVLLPTARFLNTVVESNCEFIASVLGVQFKSALVGLIYSKAMKISIIRSKDHSEGSIINYFEVDCDRLESMIKRV